MNVQPIPATVCPARTNQNPVSVTSISIRIQAPIMKHREAMIVGQRIPYQLKMNVAGKLKIRKSTWKQAIVYVI